MRQVGKNSRQRGRGVRRTNNHGQINRNTTLDSNGPEIRLRGNAQQLHEKYVTLGNDASAAGERITAEAFFQHADHYFRVYSTIVSNGDERRASQQQRHSKDANNSEANNDETNNGVSDEERHASVADRANTEGETAKAAREGDDATDPSIAS